MREDFLAGVGAAADRDDAVSLDLFRLDGKVALVTGASRGLGAAMAVALASAGADVALHASERPAAATAHGHRRRRRRTHASC